MVMQVESYIVLRRMGVWIQRCMHEWLHGCMGKCIAKIDE